MQPLAGQTVVVTRARPQAPDLVGLLQAAGAQVVEYPVIEVRGVRGDEAAEIQRAAARLQTGEYEALVFTSQNAVKHFGEHLSEAGLSQALVVFAIGAATEQAARAMFPQQRLVVAETSVSEGVMAALEGALSPLSGRRVLFPRARRGRTHLLEALAEHGAQAEGLVVYDTLPVTPQSALPNEVQWLTFMSPSAVTAYLAAAAVPPGAKVACIGPTTARAAQAAGMEVHAVAREQTSEALVQAMIEAR